MKGERCLDVTKGVEAAFGGIQEEGRVFTEEHKQRDVAVNAVQHQQEYQ